MGMEKKNTFKKNSSRAIDNSSQIGESYTMFRDLAEKCPVGVFLFQDGVLKYVNQKLAEMHGYTVDEIAGIKQTRDLVFAEDLPQLEEHIRKRLLGESTPSNFIFRGIKKTGETVYIENYDCCLAISHGHTAIIGSVVDITERRRTEEELKRYRERLEELVEERTSQLSAVNQELQHDVQKRMEVEKALKTKSHNLEDMNTALKVLLKQREDDRKEVEETIALNIRASVLRFMRLLKETRLDPNQTLLVDIVQQNLNNIISRFHNRINSFGFTLKEIEVIFLIRQGMTTKQIAKLLNVSIDAINRHRYHIRKKLGVNRQKSNLYSQLMSFE